MTRNYLTALLPALALGLAAPALADTATIELRGLDLSTEAGRAKLEVRTKAAARWACRDAGWTGARIRDMNVRNACMASVRRQAAQQLAVRAATGNAGG